jgi:hypothetical protein
MLTDDSVISFSLSSVTSAMFSSVGSQGFSALTVF